MLFNSTPFIFAFLPAVLAGVFVLGRFGWTTAVVVWLAIASTFFYAFDAPEKHLPVLLASVAFNFIAGRALLRRRSAILLATAVAANLALLGYFKYTGF